MINILKKIEKEDILGLLANSDNFRTLDVDYHPPRVKRFWTQLGENRLSFHYLYPCKEGAALYHSHPWQSAVHQLEGEYEMGITYSENLDLQYGNNTGVHNKALKEIEAAKILVKGDMYYEMLSKYAFHAVRPITLCKSVMLMGPPFNTVKNPPTQPLRQLSDTDFEEMRLWFYDFFAKL